jgi:hypothetical protein
MTPDTGDLPAGHRREIADHRRQANKWSGLHCQKEQRFYQAY